MKLTFDAVYGEDVIRHVRVLSRVQIISELILRIREHPQGGIERTLTIKRTNTPNSIQKIFDPIMLAEREMLCGYFSVSSVQHATNLVQHEFVWIGIEK